MEIGQRMVVAGVACLALAGPVPAAHAAAAAEVVKGSGDERDYRAFELGNGLEVVVVSDPGTDKAAAALDVYVGSGSDPEGRAGLAHFLEHMLFLGTQKYPEAGAYQSFISAHGGSHNAYTAFEHTNYFFDVEAGHLEGALDRFAQFFIAPLFNPEYVEREREVVHSEFVSKKKSDGRRVHSAFKRALNSAHPMSRFSVGNRETLGGEVRDELIAFYERHYSADIMALVVLGREGLDELERMVRERFAAVPDRDASPLAIEVPLFAPGSLPARLDVVPVREERQVRLTFPVPPTHEHYRRKPVEYLANLLGHEGEGSLFALLKARGWASGLSAGTGVDHRNEATVDVSVSLTEKGLEEVNAVVSHVFQYIRMLRDKGVRERLFGEQRRLSELAFRFREKEEPRRYVSRLARNMQIYPTPDIIRGPYAMDEFAPGLIRRYLERLTSDNALLTVVAKGLETAKTTPYFEAPYSLGSIPSAQVARWKGEPVAEALALPAPNVFIPESLEVKPLRDAAAKPVRLLEEPGFDLWHHQDADYRVPRASFYFSVRSPVANDTPRHAMLTELYVDLVNDKLNEYAYPARLAGIDYNIYKHIRGLSVRVNGYDDKQHLLVSRIAEVLTDPELRADRFGIYKKRLMRSIRNQREDSPYARAISEVRDLLLNPHWTEEQKLTALEPLALSDLERFVPELLSRIHVVALAHGNLLREDARRLAALLERGLVAPADPASVPRGEVVKLGRGARYVRNIRVNQPDSAVSVYFQGDDRSFERRARAALLAQIISSPFYHALRTEQRLGYIVGARRMSLLEVPGVNFLVQSPSTAPPEVEARIEGFLRRFGERLGELEPSRFETHKAGLISRILEEEERLQERSNRYWQEIDRELYTFDSRERLAGAVRAIPQSALGEIYRSYFDPARHRRLAVRAVGGRHQAAMDEPAAATHTVFIENPESFKEGMNYFRWEEPSSSEGHAGGDMSTRDASASASGSAR